MTSSALTVPVLLVGLGYGVRHALEADHLAAVATLVVRRTAWPEAARLGVFWGVGHTLTLGLLGGAMLMLDKAIPAHVAELLELVVSFMLMGLGLDCLRREVRSLVREHRHLHPDGHAYAHRHLRFERRSYRALLVGMVHGVAGSSALIVLAVGATGSAAVGLGYVVLFGVGSIVGMGLLSLTLGLGVRVCALRAEWICHALTVVAALFSCGLGVTMVVRIGVVDGLFFSASFF